MKNSFSSFAKSDFGVRSLTVINKQKQALLDLEGFVSPFCLGHPFSPCAIICHLGKEVKKAVLSN